MPKPVQKTILPPISSPTTFQKPVECSGPPEQVFKDVNDVSKKHVSLKSLISSLGSVKRGTDGKFKFRVGCYYPAEYNYEGAWLLGQIDPTKSIAVYGVWLRKLPHSSSSIPWVLEEVPIDHKDFKDMECRKPMGYGDIISKKPSSDLDLAMAYLHFTGQLALVSHCHSGDHFNRKFNGNTPPHACLVFVQSWLEDAGGKVNKKTGKASRETKYSIVSIMSLGTRPIIPKESPFTVESVLISAYSNQKLIDLDEIVYMFLAGKSQKYPHDTRKLVCDGQERLREICFGHSIDKIVSTVCNALNQPCPCVGNSFVREWQDQQVGTALYELCKPSMDSDFTKLILADFMDKKYDIPRDIIRSMILEDLVLFEGLKAFLIRNVRICLKNHGTDWDLSH